jgi:hypothetical protein
MRKPQFHNLTRQDWLVLLAISSMFVIMVSSWVLSVAMMMEPKP